MKLLFLTNIPSPYRVDFFNELGKSCDLTVTFEKEASDERDASWKRFSFDSFQGKVLKGVSVAADRAFCPGIGRFVKDRSFDEVIVTNLSSPTTLFAVLIMRIRRRRYYIEADGAFVKKESFAKRALKRFVVKGAKGFFSTCDECDRYFMKYGAGKGDIFRYPFSSMDSDALRSADCAPELSGEEWMRSRKAVSLEAKAKLGFTDEVLVLSVGRYVGFKRMDMLLKAMEGAPQNIALCIVGGDPPDKIKCLARESGAKVRFVGFKIGEELKAYYRAADIFVLPSNGEIWGLVVNEAMAYGLPVVTTDRCNAGLTLITEGKNGSLVPPDNPSAIRNALEDLSHDEQKRLSFGLSARDAVHEYSIENMCRVHIKTLCGSLYSKDD